MFDCCLLGLRQKEDPWNAILAGTFTGGVLAMRQGPRSALMSAAMGGAILSLIEGLGIYLNSWNTMAQHEQMEAMHMGLPPPNGAGGPPGAPPLPSPSPLSGGVEAASQPGASLSDGPVINLDADAELQPSKKKAGGGGGGGGGGGFLGGWFGGGGGRGKVGNAGDAGEKSGFQASSCVEDSLWRKKLQAFPPAARPLLAAQGRAERPAWW